MGSVHFPFRLADALAENCPTKQVVAAAGGVPVHAADVRRLHHRKVILEAQENTAPLLCRKKPVKSLNLYPIVLHTY